MSLSFRHKKKGNAASPGDEHDKDVKSRTWREKKKDSGMTAGGSGIEGGNKGGRVHLSTQRGGEERDKVRRTGRTATRHPRGGRIRDSHKGSSRGKQSLSFFREMEQKDPYFTIEGEFVRLSGGKRK